MRVFKGESLNEGLEIIFWNSLFFFFFKSTNVFSIYLWSYIRIFPNFEYVVIPLQKEWIPLQKVWGMLDYAKTMAVFLFQMIRYGFCSTKPCLIWPLATSLTFSLPISTSFSVRQHSVNSVPLPVQAPSAATRPSHLFLLPGMLFLRSVHCLLSHHL